MQTSFTQDHPPLSSGLRHEIGTLSDDLDAYFKRRPRRPLTPELEDRRHALLAHHTDLPPTETLTCIGDSNTMFFAGSERLRFIRYRRSAFWKPHWINRGLDLLPCFRVFHVGPSTAWKAFDHGSSTRTREKIEILLKKDVPEGSKILLSFGEIDCRIHMAKAAKAGKSIEPLTRSTAEKFIQLPAWLAARGFRPIVWGVPQIIPNDESYHTPTFPFIGPWELRRDVTYAYNGQLGRLCRELSIPIVALAGQYHPPETKPDRSFFHDGTHLSQRLMPLALRRLREVGAWD